MSDMKKLYELAKLIRSKNAGPFVVTMDILFPDHDMYQRVLESGALDRARVAALYHIDESRLQRYDLPLANAVKFSMPRKAPSGDFLDEDLYGCQQHRPLGFEIIQDLILFHCLRYLFHLLLLLLPHILPH